MQAPKVTDSKHLIVYEPPKDWGLVSMSHSVMSSISNVFWKVWQSIPGNRYALYLTSLTYRQVKTTWDPEGNPWWQQVSDRIFLGGLPLKNWDHLTMLVNDIGVEAVLSMNQDFELKKSGFINKNEPITHQEWVEAGVTHLQISATDLEPPTLDELKQAVTFIHEQVSVNRKKIYIHCKAGVGRSPAALMCYYMHYFEMNPQQAFDLVKDKRPQINLNKDQLKNLNIYYQSL